MGTTLGAEEWRLWGAVDPNARDLDLILLPGVVAGCSEALNAHALHLIRRVAVVGEKAGSYGVSGQDEDNGGENVRARVLRDREGKPFDIENRFS